MVTLLASDGALLTENGAFRKILDKHELYFSSKSRLNWSYFKQKCFQLELSSQKKEFYLNRAGVFLKKLYQNKQLKKGGLL